jgi:hypothetical protein
MLCEGVNSPDLLTAMWAMSSVAMQPSISACDNGLVLSVSAFRLMLYIVYNKKDSVLA